VSFGRKRLRPKPSDIAQESSVLSWNILVCFEKGQGRQFEPAIGHH
jgi:hypothetical protein